MWLRNPVDEVLSSRAKTSALRVVCQSPIPLTGREIGRRASIPQASAARALAELARSGIVVETIQGRAKTYELIDTQAPVVREIRGLFGAEVTRLDEVLGRLAYDVTGLVSIVLFGSQARGDATAGSDADMLFIVERRSEEIEQRIQENGARVAGRYAVWVSPQSADLQEIAQWDHDGLVFWRNVRQEGVVLWGESWSNVEGRLDFMLVAD